MNEYWNWFTRLHARRLPSMGTSPIVYSEMESFFRLNALDPDPCDIEVIEMLDRVALGIISEQQEKEQKASQAKAKK